MLDQQRSSLTALASHASVKAVVASDTERYPGPILSIGNFGSVLVTPPGFEPGTLSLEG
jgi:hypothetical protein